MTRIAPVLALTISLFARPASLGNLQDSHSTREISAQEREALVALYGATIGNNWKNHDGWLGPVGSECTWYGVICDPAESIPSAVADLDLEANNLHGRIPNDVGKLSHLRALFLERNDLSGQLPDSLIQKWLSGSLWLRVEAPLLTDVSEIDYEDSASAILCARHRVVLRSDSTAIQFAERCRDATPNDRRTFCEVRKGRIGDEEFANLAWTLEKNGYFSLRANYERSITDSAFVSTRVTRKAKEFEVVEYAGGGPLELWTIHRAIEGVSSMVEWEKPEIIAKCPRWDKSQLEQPN